MAQNEFVCDCKPINEELVKDTKEKMLSDALEIIPAEKNYPKECEEARQDSLKRIIKFIEEWQ